MKKTRALYCLYFIKNSFFVLRWKLFRIKKNCTRFRGQKNITLDYSSNLIEEYIKRGEPFAAIRYGGSEISCLNNYEKIILGWKKDYKKLVKYAMKNNAGFYPVEKEYMDRYASMFLNRLANLDILGIMGLHMEDYFHRKYSPKAKIVQYEAMEPLHSSWTKALKGKKVLVVSPFSEEIVSQYKKRERLFLDDPDILPEFDLQVLRSPISLADELPSEYASFEEALKDMEEKISQMDFDIALIGAGAYGSLLTLFVKSIGKMAIQTGGATSTLFGIMGKRWENRPHVSKHVNDDWIHPSYKPKGYEKVEGGCYW